MRGAGIIGWLTATLLALSCDGRTLVPLPESLGGEPGGPGAEAPAAGSAVQGSSALAGREISEAGARRARGPDYVPCPEDGNVDRVLDEANRRFVGGDFASAGACAELAADLVPQAVEPHHLRAVALAALGRHGDAQVAFAMALALDPDDPETLAAAADFYINVLSPRRRGTIQVGLEYARRGSERSVTRRRLDRSLRSRLYLLEAQALNDLVESELALSRAEEALELSPGLLEAVHERGVSLFNLCRFAAAEEAFLTVLRKAPDDPYAHHHLGLIYERHGRDTDAAAHFDRARMLAPADFHPPVLLPSEEFRAEVDRAIRDLDPEKRRLLAGVSLELVDIPDEEDLVAVSPPFAPTILGLYRGPPLGGEPAGAAEGAEGAPAPARAIVLFRKNLARAVKTRAELDVQIRRTLVHEIGHLQGLDEAELRRRGLE